MSNLPANLKTLSLDVYNLESVTLRALPSTLINLHVECEAILVEMLPPTLKVLRLRAATVDLCSLPSLRYLQYRCGYITQANIQALFGCTTLSGLTISTFMKNADQWEDAFALARDNKLSLPSLTALETDSYLVADYFGSPSISHLTIDSLDPTKQLLTKYPHLRRLQLVGDTGLLPLTLKELHTIRPISPSDIPPTIEILTGVYDARNRGNHSVPHFKFPELKELRVLLYSPIQANHAIRQRDMLYASLKFSPLLEKLLLPLPYVDVHQIPHSVRTLIIADKASKVVDVELLRKLAGTNVCNLGIPKPISASRLSFLTSGWEPRLAPLLKSTYAANAVRFCNPLAPLHDPAQTAYWYRLVGQVPHSSPLDGLNGVLGGQTLWLVRSGFQVQD